MDPIVERYVQLFRGRGDAYGTWEGGAVRAPLGTEMFERHLNSKSANNWIGVYPFTPYGVTWGCIDIDGKDFGHDWDRMWELAVKLHTMLAVKNVHAHIERTRNGYHLWVFPTAGLVPAATMRRALMAACKAIGYDPKEVNPKQETLGPSQLGNYVRLPYYGALAEPRSFMADRYFLPAYSEQGAALDQYSLEDFLDTVTRTDTIPLAEVAALWKPPVVVRDNRPPTGDLQKIIRAGIGATTYSLWRDGPFEGRDRSSTLVKLAYMLAEHDVPQADAFVVVQDADRRWGKFFDRADCDEQLHGIVDHAYSR